MITFLPIDVVSRAHVSLAWAQIGLLGLVGCAASQPKTTIEHEKNRQSCGRSHPAGVSRYIIRPNEDTDITTARNQVAPWSSVSHSIARFAQTVGRNPTSAEGIGVLCEPADSMSTQERNAWVGPYLKQASLLDPWGNAMRYRIPSRGIAEGMQRPSDVTGNQITLPDGARIAISPDHNTLYFFPPEYDLWSAGPDGEDGTADDVGNWAAYVTPREHARADAGVRRGLREW
jgi:Type II secretion system (T2SS), protein G